VAALWPELVERLVLLAPAGLFDMAEPGRDMFAVTTKNAPALFCETPEAYAETLAAPQGDEATLWSIYVNRGNEAAARILWPFGDTRLASRLWRVKAATLILWGQADKVIPPSYAQKFAGHLDGRASVKLIAGAGHLMELDRPEETVAAIAAAFAKERAHA
jgi:pimeloyl-ACP methyl ester carboxylesterase